MIRTLEETGVEAGRRSIEWDGEDSAGNRMAEGTYTFAVTAEDPDGNAIAATPILSGIVIAVKFEDGEAVLSVDGVDVSISDVLEIYQEQTEEA